MLAYASVTGDLAGLLLNFIQQQSLSMPETVTELESYGATSRMKYTDWWRYLELIRDEMNEPQAGLLIGQAVQTSDAGVIGYLTASCDSLVEALANFQRYQKLLYEGDLAKIEMLGDKVRFYWPYDYGYSTKESDEVLIAGMLTFFRQLLNDDSIAPISVDFICPQPDNLDLFQQVLNCEVNFSQANLAIVIDAAYLNLKLPKPDQGLNTLLQQQADSLLQGLSQQDDYLQAVRMTILKLLPLNQANLELTAKHLTTSPRSLNRRLLEKKTSFKDLLAEVRFHQAQEYLRQKTLTHSEIALLLGYSEQSAFSRAFKQWAGQTPLQFQKRFSCRRTGYFKVNFITYIAQGKCQCDAIKIEISLEKALSDYAPRKCDCDFCMARDALYLSHPKASLKIYSQQPTKIVQQGSEQAEFHCCASCDDLIAVMINVPEASNLSASYLGTVNTQLLADKDSLRSAVTVSPKQLAPAEKLERWQQAWMPIEFIIG